jgi:CHAT domain-containing protein/tetratricopeptide (TPR) repeat protein
VVLGDPDKLKAAVAAHHALLTPALRDVLIYLCLGDTVCEALLQAFGEELQDDRALGFAAFSRGREQARRVQDVEAIRSFQEAARRFTVAKELSLEAASINGIAGAYRDMGDAAKTLKYLQQALTLMRRLHGDPNPDLALCLNNVGTAYRDLGDAAKALEYYQQSLAMLRQLTDGPHPGIVLSLVSIGAAYHDLGDAARGLEYYQQALAMVRQLHDGPDEQVSLCLNNVGTAYHDLGDVAKALEYHQQALAMQRRLHDGPHPDVACSLNNVASAYRDMGDAAKSLDYSQQALAMLCQLYDGPHPHIALCLHSVGTGYRDLGDAAKALEYFQQALAMLRKLHDGPHPDVGYCLSSIGTTYHALGDDPRALQSLDDALKHLRLTPLDAPLDLNRLTERELRPLPLTVQFLYSRGSLMEQLLPASPTASQLRDCDRTYVLATAMLERLRTAVIQRDASKLKLGADVSELTPHRLDLRRRLFVAEHKLQDLEAAFHIAEEGRARVFVESLGRAHAGLLGGVSPELRGREEDLLRRLRAYDLQIDRVLHKPGRDDTGELGRLEKERQQAEDDLAALVTEMERIAPEYARLKHPRPCTLQEARSCLADNEAALLFALGRDASCVVLVEGKPAAGDGANGLAVYRLPPADEIAAKVAPLTDPDTLALPARSRSLGARLHDLLLGPLADRLKGKDLVIVPDGPLCTLPFELLVEGAEHGHGGRYLVEGHRIRYAPSLTALYGVRQWQDHRERRPDRPLWALGDPVYDAGDERLTGHEAVVADASRDAARGVQLHEGDAGTPFTRLRHSGDEVAAIGKLLAAPKDDLLTGLAASEAAVKAASASGELARARFVHFATHGVLGFGDGQQPALVLSQVGNDGRQDADGVNDGFLTLSEVTFLKLNADLVVLSACRSGRGRLYNGEGVLGLSRAFLYAGSRGVVCSQWSVDDARTAELMTALYAGLKDGRPAPEALREAQLGMLRQGLAPYYWAPFVYIGDTDTR